MIIPPIDYSRCALLIRHAEREVFPSGSFGNEVQLTEKGRTDAIEFGNRLSGKKVNHIYTSPLIRCIQTAKEIVKGLGYDVDITLTSRLGNPGMHISDSDKAGVNYLNSTAQDIYRRFSAGEILDGFTSAEVLKEQGLGFIFDHTTEEGITLFISHDSLIAHLAFACGLGDYHTRWIDYLDGVAIDCSDYSRDLMGMFTGYWNYLAIATACKVNLFDDIQCGQTSLEEIIANCGYDRQVLGSLLQTLKDAGLISDTNGSMTLTDKGRILTENHPHSLKYACMNWAAEHMTSWQSLDYTLKTGDTAFEHIFGQPFFDYISRDAEKLEVYHKAMLEYAERDYQDISITIDFGRFDSVMDVGGGYGAAISIIIKAYPEIKGYIFDRPEVVEKVRIPGVVTIGGDFFDTVPAKAQSMLLCRVLHDWPDDKAIIILSNCYSALPKEGSLFIVENCSDLIEDDLALLSLNMAAVCHSFERTSINYRELAAKCGFIFVKKTKLNALQTVLEFVKG